MRHTPFVLFLLTSTAFAAKPAEVPAAVQAIEEALAEPGFVVLDVSSLDACPEGTDGWDTPKVAGAVAAVKGRAVEIPRTRSSVDRLVGEGLSATVVRYAFQDGVEVDRICGCLEPDRMATWLVQAAAGTTAADARRVELEALAASSSTEPWPVNGWLGVVQLDYCAGRLDAAFDTARMIWDGIPDKAPENRDLRLTRVAHDMGVLATRHEPAKVQIAEMRDALEEAKETDSTALDEWVVLNRLLFDDARTFAWYEASKAEPAKAELTKRLAPNVFYMKAEAGDWAGAAAVVDDVDAWLATWKRQSGGLETATWGYAALLVADRDKEAAKLAKGILKVSDAGAACRLIAKSVEVGGTSSSQKSVAKSCDDQATVDAWTATL